jgi:hypothetical protein
MSRHLRVMLATLLIVMGVLVFSPSSYVGAGGIVANPGFELGTLEVPSGWSLSGNATRVDTGPIYEGNWTAQIAGEGGVLTQWLYLGNSTMPLQVTYNAWGWVYVTGNVTGVIALDFWVVVGNQTIQLSSTEELSTNNTDGAYVQVTGTMAAPVGATYVRIRLLGNGWDGGGEVRFDDIGLYSPTGGYCFIATAAYGTETASQLNVLRDFRDQVLLKSALGSRFVETYYKVSPPVATFIAKSDFLRAVVRVVLIDPMVNILQWSQGLWSA